MILQLLIGVPTDVSGICLIWIAAQKEYSTDLALIQNADQHVWAKFILCLKYFWCKTINVDINKIQWKHLAD